MTGVGEPAPAGGPAVCRVGEDDWQLWRAVRLAALADTPGAFGSGLQEEEALSEDAWRAMARAAAIFVATAGGAANGLATGLSRDSAHERGLGAMWVAPPWRGRGVAAMLTGAVIAWARAEGSARVGLWVPADSARARRFSERQGFRATGRSRPFPNDAGRFIDEMLLDLE